MGRFDNWTSAAALDLKTKQAAKKPKGESANKITANIIRAINSQPGCVAYRINNVGVWDEKKQVRRKGNTEKGLPDIWGCIRGQFLTVEVKAGRDKMSIDQLYRKAEIERAKGLYFTAHSTDEFLKWFVEVLR